jgi:hypothetical protein
MKATVQEMCGLDGKPRRAERDSGSVQTVEIPSELTRVWEERLDALNTIQSLAGRGLRKPGFFMPTEGTMESPLDA